MNKETLTNVNLKDDPIIEDPKEDPITEDSREDPKRTVKKIPCTKDLKKDLEKDLLN